MRKTVPRTIYTAFKVDVVEAVTKNKTPVIINRTGDNFDINFESLVFKVFVSIVNTRFMFEMFFKNLPISLSLFIHQKFGD